MLHTLPAQRNPAGQSPSARHCTHVFVAVSHFFDAVPASPVEAHPSSLLQPATQVFVAASQCSVGAQVSFAFVHATHLPLARSQTFAPGATHSRFVLHDLPPVSPTGASVVTDVSVPA